MLPRGVNRGFKNIYVGGLSKSGIKPMLYLLNENLRIRVYLRASTTYAKQDKQQGDKTI
jgi:hypothetical protein